MRSLLRMCFKLSLLGLRTRIAVIALILGVLGVISEAGFPILYALFTWVLVGQRLLLRMKERKERWYHFLIAVSGYSWMYPGYLYLFIIVLAAIAATAGCVANGMLTLTAASGFPPVEYTMILEITLAILLFNHIVLLITEVIDFEAVMTIQKVSFLGLVVAAKLLMSTDPQALLTIKLYFVAFGVLFSFLLVFCASSFLFRRKYHLG